MKNNRFVYLGYYIYKLDWSKFWLFLNFASKEVDISKFRLICNSVFSVFKYNISLLEYFQFGFYKKDNIERKDWAGTGTMYEHQLKLNPLKERVILDDKRLFFKKYAKFIIHKIATIDDLIQNPKIGEELLTIHSKKLVFKVSDGKCGVGVSILNVSKFKNSNDIIEFMQKEKFDLVEEFIIQHPKLNELSPSGVNTVRVFSQLTNRNTVAILGCRQRISVNSPVDNMAAGNLVAPIDEKTGIINGLGVYSDITKKHETHHPITGVKLIGFQIPFWPEILSMVNEASLLHPQNRSIGWDIVVTENGPGFIEGNHDWCKLVWQLPVNKGLKHLLYEDI